MVYLQQVIFPIFVQYISPAGDYIQIHTDVPTLTKIYKLRSHLKLNKTETLFKNPAAGQT